MSKTIEYFGNASIDILTEQYTSGHLYVELVVDQEPYATLSVCFPELHLACDEFVFKTYSENQGLYQIMLSASLVELVRMERTVCGWLPVCRLSTP